MEQSVVAIKLVLKTGLVFANCDGDFDSREREYIKSFVEMLLNDKQLIDSVRDEPDSLSMLRTELLSMSGKYDFGEVVAETKVFFDSLAPSDQKIAKETFHQFILTLIEKDDKVTQTEKDLLSQWESLLM